jgi:hypothetical protein
MSMQTLETLAADVVVRHRMMQEFHCDRTTHAYRAAATAFITAGHGQTGIGKGLVVSVTPDWQKAHAAGTLADKAHHFINITEF